jgi:hypothetical protein
MNFSVHSFGLGRPEPRSSTGRKRWVKKDLESCREPTERGEAAGEMERKPEKHLSSRT